MGWVQDGAQAVRQSNYVAIALLPGVAGPAEAEGVRFRPDMGGRFMLKIPCPAQVVDVDGPKPASMLRRR